jgi:hypothetical protein
MARIDFDIDGGSPEAVAYEALHGTILGYVMLQGQAHGGDFLTKPDEVAERLCRQLAAIVIENLQQFGHMDREMAGPGPNDEI